MAISDVPFTFRRPSTPWAPWVGKEGREGGREGGESETCLSFPGEGGGEGQEYLHHASLNKAEGVRLVGVDVQD